MEIKLVMTGLQPKCMVGRAGTNPDSNIVTGMFLLNNRYASILFDTGADRSFVSTTFSSQMDITPSTLDHYYDVELADGRIISNRGHEARLHIISYSKTQEYMLKGCPVFLAHVTTNEVEDKSEKKRLEDVPIVQDFPKVFLEDLPVLLQLDSGILNRFDTWCAPVRSGALIDWHSSEMKRCQSN
ncbi:putative reverse transcriptase domain-containing protein [Tanacetum coccineum]